MKRNASRFGVIVAICSLSLSACGNRGQAKASSEARSRLPNVEIRKIASSIKSVGVQKVVVEFEETTMREIGERAEMRTVSFTNRNEVEKLLRALRVSSRRGGVEVFDGFMRPTDNVVIYLKDGGSRRFCMSTLFEVRIRDHFGPEVEHLYWKYRNLAFPPKKKP